MHNANFSTVRAFLFDLDGTLIDSKLDLVNSVNFMLGEMQRDVLPLATVASYIGHGAPRLVANALGPDAAEADRQRGLEIFLAHYNEHNLDATRAYPGVVEGLEALQDRPMAVLTNKPKQMSVEILEALSLLKYFRAVYGGDSFEKKKPDPAGAQSILKDLGAQPQEAAMVGDSDVDIKTARNAGMLAIGVNYGFGQHDRTAQPADHYVDSLREIAALAMPSR
jgi:phosphoglycolate phosphatase